MAGSRRFAAGAVTLVVAATAAVALVTSESTQPGEDRVERQAAVAERGRDVMPFDLEKTTHRFTRTATGGIQDVVADQSGDSEQIDLIRSHLRKEAEAFSRGDFADPARIHGVDMPGLTDLKHGHDRIEVRYEERADGGSLIYTTDDSVLVHALHGWFKAQLSDHGNHAESGH